MKMTSKRKPHTYLMMYKPEGYVSANRDKSNKTIISLLPPQYQELRLNIVGRLDKDVTGLILLTTNTKLFKYLINPINHIEKKYLVTYSGDKKYIDQDISKGIVLDNDYKTRPFKLDFLSSSQALITITEGKYHEVKNIFSSLHMHVDELKRISIGPLTLSDLSLGEVRQLNENEVENLIKLIKK